jgi:hypothetical protein
MTKYTKTEKFYNSVAYTLVNVPLCLLLLINATAVTLLAMVTLAMAVPAIIQVESRSKKQIQAKSTGFQRKLATPYFKFHSAILTIFKP